MKKNKCNICGGSGNFFRKKRGICNSCACREWKRATGYKTIGIMRNVRFGGMRESVVRRDNYSCRKCGITEEEHTKTVGIGLSIHHIDGNGRYSDYKNNNLDNLVTLCSSCHGYLEQAIKRLCLN